jgi:hypothetical protein
MKKNIEVDVNIAVLVHTLIAIKNIGGYYDIPALIKDSARDGFLTTESNRYSVMRVDAKYGSDDERFAFVFTENETDVHIHFEWYESSFNEPQDFDILNSAKIVKPSVKEITVWE